MSTPWSWSGFMATLEYQSPKHISLLDQIDEDEEQSALMHAIMKAVPELEREHAVLITEASVCWATYLTHRHFSQTLSGRALEEMAIDILNSGCFLLKSEINGHANEKRIDELEYILSRCIVESAELLRENPECKQWLTRVDKEYMAATTALTMFVTTWKPFLMTSLVQQQAHIQESLQSRLATTSACIYSACQTDKFLDQTDKFLNCYFELKELDTVASKIEVIQMALDRRYIGEVVSSLIGIPLPMLPTYGSSQLSSLANSLRKRVVDQDGAINDIYESIFTNSRLHPDSENRPRASLLFLGPSGVGKTEVVKCITEVFFSSLDRLIRVDMSKYGEPHYESGLQWLAETISKEPYSLILFDKIEKSHLDAMGSHLLDIVCGKLTDKDGHSVNLSNVIVIMTSHAGAEKLTSSCACSIAFRREVECFPDSVDRVHECCLKTSTKDHVLEEARTIFSPDFLNVLDGTIVFDSFRLGVENVSRHILREMVQAISLNKLVVCPSNHVLDVISSNYFKQPGKGAKAIKSWLEENMMPPLCGIVEDMANKQCTPCTVYIDTLVGTEELSFRLDETDFTEEWMAKHFKLSFRKFRSLYQLENRIVELRNCLSSLLNPIDDRKSNTQKHFWDAAMHVKGISDKILQSGWSLDMDETKELLYSEVPTNTESSLHTERECGHCQNLKARLLQQRDTIQNQAVNMIANAVLESIDLSVDNSNKSPRSFLLMGLTSFGRIELVKTLIDHFNITNNEKTLLVRVDFSNDENYQSQPFSSSHSSESYASPILEAVRNCPYSVLLFDQIEKANASVFGTLLKILDTGMLNDGQNSMVDFRSTTIIVTTNIGNTDMIAKFFSCSTPSTFEEIDAREVVKPFRSELVYRMDEIVLFDPWAKEQMNIFRLILKKEGIFLNADLRENRQFIYSLFQDYGALSEDTDSDISEESITEDWIIINHDEIVNESGDSSILD